MYESAYPWIAGTFTAAGADVLINISNDGYRADGGDASAPSKIFRAVENERPLLRVTNTGITAYISPSGEVREPTPGFQQAVRTWTVTPVEKAQTFYTRHGDLFVGICAVFSPLVFALTFRTLAPATWFRV